MKLCECGCGQPTNRYTKNNYKRGQIKGEYARYLPSHYSRTQHFRDLVATVDPERTKHVGSSNGYWKGGRRIDGQGYVVIRVGTNTEVREHRLVAEQMLGRPLTELEVVHHKNGDRSDNRPENLEVLASQSEHMRIHMTSEEARRRAAIAAVADAALTPPPPHSETD